LPFTRGAALKRLRRRYWAIFYGRHNCRFSPVAHRGGRVIGADVLRISALLRVSRDGQEREQGSEDNPNVHAHQGKPCDAWEVLALRSAALLTRACPPAIAYSRVDTSRTLSAVPSSSNFPASYSGLASGLVAQSYRTFFDLRLSAICTIGSSRHCYDPD
jgi:hypothetical protein